MTRTQRNITLAIVLILIAGLLYFLTDKNDAVGNVEVTTTTAIEKEGKYPKAREIAAPNGFINSPHGNGSEAFSVAEYIGKKVVLVDFWTYSCINCIRTQPYLNAWYDKYENDGLVIIGVHTPEFDFEKRYDNVAQAVKDEGIRYPVVLDNDYGTWRAYQNSYWPRKYLIDIDGYIVYDHIGEGGYDETEVMIQKALTERAARLGGGTKNIEGMVSVKDESVRDGMPRTPEIYFGAFRNQEYLANGATGKIGGQTFVAPTTEEQRTDALYLNGAWNITPEYAEGDAGSSIRLRFQGKSVFFVASSEKGAKVRVLIDGESFNAGFSGTAGSDVENGVVQVQNEKLYRIIEGEEWGMHDLELIVEQGVLEAFTFTFG